MNSPDFKHANEILDHYLSIFRRSNMSEEAIKNLLVSALETAYNDFSNMNIGEFRSFVMSPEASTKIGRRIQYLSKSTDMKFLYRTIDGVIVISRFK